jgi:hypothetical protein
MERNQNRQQQDVEARAASAEIVSNIKRAIMTGILRTGDGLAMKKKDRIEASQGDVEILAEVGEEEQNSAIRR